MDSKGAFSQHQMVIASLVFMGRFSGKKTRIFESKWLVV